MRTNRRSGGPLARIARNLRSGRGQQTLAAATAGAALPLAGEVWLNHYSGSFANKWMWSPVVLLPALTASASAAIGSERAAKSWLPAVSAAVAVNGLLGTYFHARGIARKPGGFADPTYNLVTGPPPLAPGSLTMVGGIGLLAAVMRRERW